MQPLLLGNLPTAVKGREQVRGSHICAAAPPLSNPQSISKTEDIREAAQRRGINLSSKEFHSLL